MSSGTVVRHAPMLLRVPADRRGSGAGVDAVELAASAGLVLDDWQADFLIESLAESSSGLWAAASVGLVVPRQNGKGSVLEARQLAGLFLLGEPLQVHTAHEFKTCFEHFLRVVRLVESTPDLDRLVQRVRRGAGEQAIELRSGERLRFLARSGGSARGFSAPTVYLDEAFAATAPMVGALQYAQSAMPNPQTWLTSSAPPVGSAVLRNAIRIAEAGSHPRQLFAMFSASPTGDRSDVERWAEANPGFPHRISREAILGELLACGDDPDLLAEFDRERLGLVAEVNAAQSAIDLDVWARLIDESFEMTGRPFVALDVGESFSSLCAAQVDAAGVTHVEVVERAQGTDWVVAACRRAGLPVRVAKSSPAAGLVSRLVGAGVEVVEVAASQLPTACSAFAKAVDDGLVRHRDDAFLVAALRSAVRRQSGDVWQWSRSSSSADISALVAVTLAFDAAQVPAVPLVFAY